LGLEAKLIALLSRWRILVPFVNFLRRIKLGFKRFEKRDSLLDPQRFKAWILRIASNSCNDYFREQAKSLEIEWQDSIVAAI